MFCYLWGIVGLNFPQTNVDRQTWNLGGACRCYGFCGFCLVEGGFQATSVGKYRQTCIYNPHPLYNPSFHFVLHLPQFPFHSPLLGQHSYIPPIKAIVLSYQPSRQVQGFFLGNLSVAADLLLYQRLFMRERAIQWWTCVPVSKFTPADAASSKDEKH